MPATQLARTLTLEQLTPSDGLTSVAHGWHADGNRVQFTAEQPLAPGWYQLKLRLRSGGNFTIRKRAELTFDAGLDKPISKDVMAWNRLLDERFLLHLPRESASMTLSLFHVEGDFDLERFELSRISNSMVAVAAFQEKLRLIKAYNCLKPVLKRGAGLLFRGQFRAFRTKVYNGLADSRAMRFGTYKANEVDASWWRRHALAPVEAEEIRQACDAMTAPPPLAVLLLVDPKNFDRVRLAAHSVRRQIYPHWELLLACSGPAWLQPHLAMILGGDLRVKIALVDEADGLGAAIARSIADTECDRIVVLPPGLELAESALYHFARSVKADPELASACGRIYDGVSRANDSTEGGRIWLTSTWRLGDTAPSSFKPAAIAKWVSDGVPIANRKDLEPILAYPLDDSPLIDRARVGTAPRTRTQRLHIGGDLHGISGWDHVVYSVLRGLPTFGVKLLQHPVSKIRADLVPPQFLPLVRSRTPDQKQLAISPPFLAERFRLDGNSALFTMWETDALPPSCVRTLNGAGLVIVPSPWSVDCFRHSGVTVPMEVAPLGCDQLVYNADGSFPEICTFGTAGALAAGGLRKNAQRMIDLFRRAFPTEQEVRLRVKISPSSPAIETYDDSRIDVVRAVLPHAELAGWYRSLTAYVNGSFGEGFGLHLIEAMACGRPLITANYSGLTAFFETHLGYSIDYKLVPVKNDIYIGQWADPSDESILAAMHRVFANQSEARELGERSAARAKNFSWKATGRQLHAALVKHGFLVGVQPLGCASAGESSSPDAGEVGPRRLGPSHRSDTRKPARTT